MHTLIELSKSYVILLGVTIFTLASCTQQEGPLADYYFPMEDAVYVFSSNDSIGREYWVVKTDGEALRTTIYDGAFQLNQETIEKRYGNGINLERLTMTRQADKIDVDISSGYVFPFDEIDSSEVVFYQINWQLIDENNAPVSYELVRNRRFIGYEDKVVLGQQKQCIKFKLDERIITDMDGSIELNTTGIEYYARDIGLVYRQRRVTEDLMMEQELLEILNVEEFAALINQ